MVDDFVYHKFSKNKYIFLVLYVDVENKIDHMGKSYMLIYRKSNVYEIIMYPLGFYLMSKQLSIYIGLPAI